MGEVNYAPVIQDMVWSYSRVKAFDDCPYRWYLRYIRKLPSKEMFFSSYGSFIHKLIELYYKEGKTSKQLTDMYLSGFKENVSGRAPNPKIFTNYFKDGLRYLREIKPFPFSLNEVEKRVDFNLDGIPFVGYIDFLGEKDGELYVVDNKSRNLKPRSTKGKHTKSDEDLDSYLKQMAEKVSDDLFIMPISVHELVVVKKKSSKPVGELKKILKSINKESPTDEILSDKIYLFNRKRGKITVAC